MSQCKEITFTGPFAPMCRTHIDQKIALGMSSNTEARILKRFDEFSKTFLVENFCITEELALAWSKQRPNESEATRLSRIGVMQRFAAFLVRQGHQSFMLPFSMRKPRMHTPYIFTKDELHRIFIRLGSMEPSPMSPLMHLSMPLLFKTLYGCGLRISEALALQFHDVDLHQGVIHVRHGKNENERLVPISTSLLCLCKKYVNNVPANRRGGTFFHTKKQQPYERTGVGNRFRAILWDAGISYRGRNVGPRVHDLRHTFVCHRLKSWADEDQDIGSLLPILSKYLGHNSIAGTEWYLKLTAEAYPQITEKMQIATGHIFPDITGIHYGGDNE